MLDQLRIENKYSYDDFLASVKTRNINAPKKKEIKETIPFSNKTYDFSKIEGEIYWEERELEYIFEIMADSPEALEDLKTDFQTWVMNVIEGKLYDPFILDYHFIVTFSDIDFDDDEDIEKTTITVKFTAYPYKIANKKTVHKIELTASESKSIEIKNISSHRITPTFLNTSPITVQMGNSSYSVPSGEITDDSFKLESGLTTLTLQSSNNCSVEISYFAEVF